MECDAQDLSVFDTGSFDIVHAHQVVLHLSKPLQAMQDMRRVVKPGGIVSTCDNSALFRIPVLQALERQVEIWHRFSRSRGADPHLGRVSHIAAQNAGFEWDHIQISSWGWEWSDKEAKENWAQLGKVGMWKQYFEGEFGTEAEMEDAVVAWDAWKALPEARCMELDGALLCWK